MGLAVGEVSRRGLMRGIVFGGACIAAVPARAFIPSLLGDGVRPLLGDGPRPALVQRALAAMQQHSARLAARDLIGVVDFAQASATPRLHLVDVLSGRATSLLVAHGRGSDPDHTGFLQRFSNEDGSAASSSGAYVTEDIYIGKHGRSRRIAGLDMTNSNALRRSIVVHSADYVSAAMIAEHGKLGRSEGCFAVSARDLEQVLARLGSGRMIYADKA